VRLDDEEAAVIDLQFLVELLTLGVYYSIFNGLPPERRETKGARACGTIQGARRGATARRIEILVFCFKRCPNDACWLNSLRRKHMNKGKLIDKIAMDAKISKVQASNALNSAIDSVTSSLKKGGSVTLLGFGTFSVRSRKARTGRNPQTGARLMIPAKKVAKFVAGAKLRKAVNRGR